MTKPSTANGRPIPAGFTGTLPDFLDWLAGYVSGYASLIVSEPRPCSWNPNRGLVHHVEAVTGGYSDDEDLFSRLRHSMFGFRFWESSHRGGLTVYEVPVSALESADEVTWMEPITDVFQTIYRARSVRLDTGHGHTTFPAVHGVELSFCETDTDGYDRFGTLYVRQIDGSEFPDILRPSAVDTRPLSSDEVNELLSLEVDPQASSSS